MAEREEDLNGRERKDTVPKKTRRKTREKGRRGNRERSQPIWSQRKKNI